MSSETPAAVAVSPIVRFDCRRAAYKRCPSVAPGAVAARVVSSSIWRRTALSALISAGVTMLSRAAREATASS